MRWNKFWFKFQQSFVFEVPYENTKWWPSALTICASPKLSERNYGIHDYFDFWHISEIYVHMPKMANAGNDSNHLYSVGHFPINSIYHGGVNKLCSAFFKYILPMVEYICLISTTAETSPKSLKLGRSNDIIFCFHCSCASMYEREIFNRNKGTYCRRWLMG